MTKEIINTDLDYWGAYSYEEKSDVLRIKVQAGSKLNPKSALENLFHL